LPTETNYSAGGEENRRLLQAQKKLLKERNYQAYLQRLEKQEEERLEKNVFHNCYKNSEYVKQVRMYKEVKNDLFNWGQLLNIISNFIMVIAFIIFVFIILSMALNSYPFILSTVIE